MQYTKFLLDQTFWAVKNHTMNYFFFTPILGKYAKKKNPTGLVRFVYYSNHDRIVITILHKPTLMGVFFLVRKSVNWPPQEFEEWHFEDVIQWTKMQWIVEKGLIGIKSSTLSWPEVILLIRAQQRGKRQDGERRNIPSFYFLAEQNIFLLCRPFWAEIPRFRLLFPRLVSVTIKRHTFECSISY